MTGRIGLFEAVGVELEYMIVDASTLGVRPVADRLIEAEAGSPLSEIERGRVAWSNELVLHVLELKTNGPTPSMEGLAGLFHEEIRRAGRHLEALDARLMPTGMHPLMDPHRETRLWPHEYNDVYRTFDRIFGCQGHGWANLQSTHLNLPFASDEELSALHSAVRIVLPLIPALAASSPLQEGRMGGSMDGRVAAYCSNARRVPSVTGLVIPEPTSGRAQYEREVLGPIYADLEPHDPDGVLRHEWVNARGAIVRFGRGSVEIRLIDAQESARADLAVGAAVHEAVRWLTLEPPVGPQRMDAFATERLAAILDATVREGDRAPIADAEYLDLLGAPGRVSTAGEVWRHVVESGLARRAGSDEWAEAIETIFDEGCLARRIARSVGDDAPRERVLAEYGRLCACLADSTIYRASRT